MQKGISMIILSLFSRTLHEEYEEDGWGEDEGIDNGESQELSERDTHHWKKYLMEREKML